MVATSQTPRGAVFVLGMHRSGTSALTRGLEVLGVELGRNLKEPVAGDNEKGFFEDWALSIINDDLLALRGGQWDSLFTDEPGAETTEAVNTLKLRALAAIDKEFGRARYFGFKDPRTCRTLPFWKDVLARMGVAPFYLITFRNPLNVAKSLEKRDGMPRERAYYLWLLHTLSAIRNTEGEKRVFVDYDDLIADPRRVLENVSAMIGDPEIAIDDAALRAYDREFLDPSLQHNRERASYLALDNACPELVRDVYAALRGETGAEQAPAQSWLDLIAAFEAGNWRSSLLDVLDRDIRAGRLLRVELEGEVSRLNTERADLLRKLALEVERSATESVNAAKLRRELDVSAGQLRGVLESLTAANTHVAGLEQQLQAATSASSEFETRLHAREADFAALGADLARAQRQAQAAEQAEAIRAQAVARQGAEAARRHGADVSQAHLEQIAILQGANAALSQRMRDLYASSSWRMMAPVRTLKALFTGRGVDESVPLPPVLPPIQVEPPAMPVAAPSADFVASQPRAYAASTLTFFTICSRNFLAFAKTLFQSLREHHPDVRFYVALCDAPDAQAPFDPATEPFPIVYLDDLDLPQWRDMAQRYNITEFNTAIKPFVIRHLMRKHPGECIVYLDPDIIVKSRLVELEEALGSGASVVLTPHITNPAENAESNDGTMLRYGIYNLGFVAFQNTPQAAAAVEWWGRRLIDQCVIDLPNGIFVDQKWADLLPAFLSDSFILRHPGYNVAYWNVSQRQVTQSGGQYFVNGQPLRFAHFSGSKLDDPKVFSRHTSQFNAQNIGELNKLLDEYRARVFANNHAHYQRIPYAFSWLGASGVNEHTPKPAYEPAAGAEQTTTPGIGAPNGVVGAYEMVRTATKMAGGLPQLAAKTARALQSGGLGALRERIRIVREVAAGGADSHPGLAARALRTEDPEPQTEAELNAGTQLGWRKRLLYIDWSTPRPDRDAGSLTAYHLLESLIHHGYDVSFVPADLEYLGAYTDALRALGVRCLHREDIGSLEAHLARSGHEYDFAFICRAPIAADAIPHIRRHAPQAKIILNTCDLHYLRDTREAELSGDPEKIKAAAAAKKWELDILHSCDVSIVLSHVELDIVKRELPNADVRHIPLMIASMAANPPGFDARKDMLFIGSFPHKPNVDAALYFAREVFPLIRAKLPNAIWHVIGNDPPPEVQALAHVPGIRVHGFVKDLEPIFSSVRLSVAPLRYGAGIKGKLGTSMAFGAPAVGTTIAVEGMGLVDGEHVLVADVAQAFADAVVRLHEEKALWERLSAAGYKEMLHEHSVAAVQGRIGALMHSVSPGYPAMEMYELRSFDEYNQLKEFLRDQLPERRRTELELIEPDQSSFITRGFCSVCGQPSSFTTSFLYASKRAEDGREIPNWREHVACVHCGFSNRLRASLHLFDALMRPREDADIYITEQTTPMYAWLKERYPNLVGSEYLGDRCTLGETSDGLRNEDLTQLTFQANTFDYVLSFDVMEHVVDDVGAIKEVYRTLKAGGRFFFAAPFSAVHPQKVVRARMRPDGEIEHIMPAEYHGNPVDPENGALCYRYLAWDVLDDLKSAGFVNCRVIQYWSRDLAYLGVEQFLIAADKPKASKAH
jgi:glycosyltransferase involved in cell wall biosynthesis/SAM-dependent methyltransferase